MTFATLSFLFRPPNAISSTLLKRHSPNEVFEVRLLVLWYIQLYSTLASTTVCLPWDFVFLTRILRKILFLPFYVALAYPVQYFYNLWPTLQLYLDCWFPFEALISDMTLSLLNNTVPQKALHWKSKIYETPIVLIRYYRSCCKQ